MKRETFMPAQGLNLPSVKVLGSRIHIVDVPQIVSIMSGWIEDYREGVRCKEIIVTGYHGIWEAYKDREFRTMLNSADLWVPDGIAPVVVARRRGFHNAVRAPGAEIMPAFFRLADKKGYSSFFYGDREDTLEALEKNLKSQYPGHKTAGVFSPPFRQLSPEEESEHVRMINNARPDVLWVGLGLPKQERWIHRNLERLNVPVAIGVGACFIFFSGKVKRAPEWVGRMGFEWVWRLLQEPRKLWRRTLIEAPQFVYHVIMELTGIRKYD